MIFSLISYSIVISLCSIVLVGLLLRTQRKLDKLEFDNGMQKYDYEFEIGQLQTRNKILSNQCDELKNDVVYYKKNIKASTEIKDNLVNKCNEKNKEIQFYKSHVGRTIVKMWEDK